MGRIGRQSRGRSGDPDQLAAGLADDEDLGVRVLLAQHHPAAPPALLLRSFLEYRGPGRRDLVRRPGFPVDGLARFAADPDPYARALAARDPSVEPDLVARLLDDPQEVVRRAMARCPRLPVNRLVDLLDDADLAEYAAANPSLPATEMLRILASG